MSSKTLRSTQINKAKECHSILSEYGFVYLVGQVRTGKTGTSLQVARLFGAKNVLFLTKKKAIGEKGTESTESHGVIGDYYDFGFDKHFNLTVINDESMHKVEGEFDLVIHDEHHRFGGFPKPSKYAKTFREAYYMLPVITLSGTPYPESPSQLYHQFWINKSNPWFRYKNFYAWAKDGYVDTWKMRLGTHDAVQYDRGNEDKIMLDIKHLMVTLTQEEVGFSAKVEEKFLYVDMNERTKKMIKTLSKDLVLEGKDEVVLGETPAKLQSKILQLCSGTIKFESGNSMTVDYSKVDFIIEKFKGKKLAIFYIFKEEFNALKDRLGDKLTDNISEFNSDPNKWIALQTVSGREGTNLSKADFLVNINIHFSALSYFQLRDRMLTMERTSNMVYWVFSVGGLESYVYKSVCKKKSYTTKLFSKDINKLFTDEEKR